MKVIVSILSCLANNARGKYAIETIKSIIYSFESFRFYEMCKIIIIYSIPFPFVIDVYDDVCSGYRNVELYKKTFPISHDDYLTHLSLLVSSQDILFFSDDSTLFHPDKISFIVSLLSSRVIIRHSIYILPSYISSFERFLREKSIIPSIKKEERCTNLFSEFVFYGGDLKEMVLSKKIPSDKIVIYVEGYYLSYHFYL